MRPDDVELGSLALQAHGCAALGSGEKVRASVGELNAVRLEASVEGGSAVRFNRLSRLQQSGGRQEYQTIGKAQGAGTLTA